MLECDAIRLLHAMCISVCEWDCACVCVCVCVLDLFQCILWYFAFDMRSYCNETMLNAFTTKLSFVSSRKRNYNTEAKIGTLFAPWFIRPLLLVASLFPSYFARLRTSMSDWMNDRNNRSFFTHTHSISIS